MLWKLHYWGISYLSYGSSSATSLYVIQGPDFASPTVSGLGKAKLDGQEPFVDVKCQVKGLEEDKICLPSDCKADCKL